MRLNRWLIGACALCPALAAAQQTSAPAGASGMPGNPYQRPDSMDAHDALSDPSAIDRQYFNARDRQKIDGAPAATVMAGGASPAVAADFVAGTPVYDRGGRLIGKLGISDASNAVVSSAGGAVAVPTQAFGKNRNGLLLSLTKSQFDKLVASANAPH